MAIFTKEKESGSSLLGKKSNSVLDVFVQTISSLKQIVAEAVDQAEQCQKEIEAATLEKQNLEQIVASNEQIITKIQAIIEPNHEIQEKP